jgi:hypothetical protein
MDGIDPSQPPHSSDTHQRSPEHQVDLPFDDQEQTPSLQPFSSGAQPLLLQQTPEQLDHHAWPPPVASVTVETPWMLTQNGTYPYTDDYSSDFTFQQDADRGSLQMRPLMYSPVETLSSSSFPSLSTHTSYSASPLTPDNHGGHRERKQQQQQQRQQQHHHHQQHQHHHQQLHHQQHYQQPASSHWATTDGDVSISARNRPIAPRQTSVTSTTSQEPTSRPSLTKRQGKEDDREYRRVKAKRNRVKNKTREEQLLTLEEELLEQNKELSAQADDLKDEVLGLKNEILSHAWCDNELIAQYINGQAAHL